MDKSKRNLMIGTAALPFAWHKPIVETIFTPAHAQTSPTNPRVDPPVKPIDPTDPVDPVDPIDPVDPVDPPCVAPLVTYEWKQIGEEEYELYLGATEQVLWDYAVVGASVTTDGPDSGTQSFIRVALKCKQSVAIVVTVTHSCGTITDTYVLTGSCK